MLFLKLVSLASLCFAATAPITNDSPQGVSYKATFKPNDKYNISGTVKFSATTNGSFWVEVAIKDLPSLETNAFPYHVHVKPVPTDGNCTATLGHLNPYNGTVNATTAAGKEAGDLAGKHGNLVGPSFETSYIDEFLSLNPSDPAFVGNNRSVVIHDIANNRLTCANIELEVESNSTSSASPSASAHASSSSVHASASVSSSHSGAAAGSAPWNLFAAVLGVFARIA